VTAPISVCLIVRDEIAQLERCLSSIRPHVAEIVVVDTGSTDGSPAVARRFADKFESYSGCNHPNGLIRSFSDARQRSFALASQPWTMWIDGDDEVVGAEHLPHLIDQFDRVRAGAPSMVTMPYEYAHDEFGNVIVVQDRERLVSPKESFRWVGRVHENLIPTSSDVRQRTDVVKIVHKRDLLRKIVEPGRNLRILKEQYESEGDSDARHLYYLGLEYGNNGDIENSIKFLEKYVDKSGWDEEKCQAYLKISDHYTSRGDFDNAISWAARASAICEKWAEPYFALAKCFYYIAQRGKDTHRNWERCVNFAQRGLSMPPTVTPLFINPLDRSFEIHKFLNVALANTGRAAEALESVRAGLAVKPEDIHLNANRKMYEKHFAKESLASSLSILASNGDISPEVAAHVESVVSSNSIPRLVESRTVLRGDGKDIIFFVGGGVESWNPETAAKNGIGGSETAVIEMSKRLAARGHRVRVFGDCESIGGTFSGVEYIHHTKYGNTECDILITSRRPHAVDDSHNISATIRLCWVHDIHCGSDLTHARAIRIDRFLTLSQWHRGFFLSHHRCVHPDQVMVTRNGIDLGRFSKNVDRNPKRAVYSSSPDRGMQVAVAIWPRVRERVPDAELHIYYGFQTWEACADAPQKALIEGLKRMLKDYETAGVVFHGRVPQSVLADEYLKSGVWAYPTWFSETSCISAMEAQAAGLRMITSPIAALNETVGDRGTLISGDWTSLDYQNRFIDGVVSAMTKTGDSDRQALQSYATQNFGWDSLADEWSSMFDTIIEEVKRDIMPPYVSVI